MTTPDQPTATATATPTPTNTLSSEWRKMADLCIARANKWEDEHPCHEDSASRGSASAFWQCAREVEPLERELSSAQAELAAAKAEVARLKTERDHLSESVAEFSTQSTSLYIERDQLRAALDVAEGALKWVDPRFEK